MDVRVDSTERARPADEDPSLWCARIHGVSPSPSGILYNFNEWYVPKAQQRYTSG